MFHTQFTDEKALYSRYKWKPDKKDRVKIDKNANIIGYIGENFKTIFTKTSNLVGSE